MKGNTLFENFNPVSEKEWKQKIQYDLKGKDYNEEVVWNSPEGIKVKPFYHAEDLEHIAGASSHITSWNIGQVIYAGNAIMANEKALKYIAKGAKAIRFVIPTNAVDASVILNNIDLNVINVYFDMQFLSKDYIAQILDKVTDSNKIHFQIDPIGHLARSGNWYESMSSDIHIVNDLAALNIDNLLSVDVSLYQNAGADMVQQLADALSHANEYLNILQESGNLTNLKNIDFKVAVGGNYFFEIAKIKALRNLWNVLAQAYEISIPCHITTQPSKRNKTIYDYNVNLLRTTTECMSALLGGSDSVFNLNYNSEYKKDNDFAERIAFNQLLLLKEESYFDKVENPAEGSYYIETISTQLAEKALILFKAIEKDGGFLKQLKNHTIQNRIADSAKKQQEKFNTKKTVLVGSNAFQNENDKMAQEIELYPFVKKNPRKTLITPIIEKRLAEELEQNRLSHE
ncbi:heterodimeric methylmalonyl-CoA mutase small subunit [Maribacter caenipelagi]|uniref:Heterodimeric methylmalonyl-CoA mutase small subunit n=1 Tax=Maribacter caenipelagi TaxID=1447781 RepID=A0A4R7DFW3_9FLAO|nr:methylmalonyl-CoA mutase subunit beta [Maribacter caenipelagi]TDS18904.1 heterodimeric methylmalonyl-CoA mutase small subunit [Maribacter caenipelagi]